MNARLVPLTFLLFVIVPFVSTKDEYYVIEEEGNAGTKEEDYAVEEEGNALQWPPDIMEVLKVERTCKLMEDGAEGESFFCNSWQKGEKPKDLPEFFESWISCCGVCNLILERYEGLAHFDMKRFILLTLKLVCDVSSQPDVCRMAVDNYEDMVYEILRQTKLSYREVCSLLLIDNCDKADARMMHNWTIVVLPKPAASVTPIPQPGSPVSRVLQITDIHIDPYYTAGAMANCPLALCCRKSSGKPLKPSDKAGQWGDFRNCDLPVRTIENLLKHITKTHQLDYVIWTGDSPPHDPWINTMKEVKDVLNQTTDLLHRHFKGIPVFPVIGNHDGFPTNMFAVPKGHNQIRSFYNYLANLWKIWLPHQAQETMKLGGYYSVVVKPGLRVISLNTNYCYGLNFWILVNMVDPADQLHWLALILQEAEDKKEKVHIIGHVAPGNARCYRRWSYNYYRILQRYESTITAQFFAHAHYDLFEIFYNTEEYHDKSDATSIAYLAPSVTPYCGLNPGYRIYTIDGFYERSSHVVLDHETYIMNLTEANLHLQAEWKLEYSAREAFGMASLLPYEWNMLTKRFERDDKLFQKFYRYVTKNSDYSIKLCQGKCKTMVMCQLRRGYNDHVC